MAMVKAYAATMKIKHGTADGSTVMFEPGEVVKGLSTEEMASLWEAGALTETEVNDEPVAGKAASEQDSTSSDTPTEPVSSDAATTPDSTVTSEGGDTKAGA